MKSITDDALLEVIADARKKKKKTLHPETHRVSTWPLLIVARQKRLRINCGGSYMYTHKRTSSNIPYNRFFGFSIFHTV